MGGQPVRDPRAAIDAPVHAWAQAGYTEDRVVTAMVARSSRETPVAALSRFLIRFQRVEFSPGPITFPGIAFSIPRGF
ncbi:MAG TPA: hypothetical protein DDY91_20510 [Planctomycetaceae bacterium]|nr:hypothetical protein [Planctomycetaceae bacterium]